MPCFSTGTFITTLSGEIAVEALEPGHRVVTRDNGLQTVRRIERRDLDYGQLASLPHLRPILVTIGAMGTALPERDMLVSPNMRLLASGDMAPFGVSDREALTAAKLLTNNHGIRPCQVLGVRYVHVVFDKHEVVLANGVWAECFQSADASLGALGNAQRLELLELFPALADAAADDRLGTLP